MPHSVLKFFLLLLVTALAACGGGGSSGPVTAVATISGKAAVGAPIVGGTVTVVCAAGSTLSPATTDQYGSWTVTVTGQTLPCKVRVVGGTIDVGGSNNLLTYYSAALKTGTVNVTPLTDLMVANLVGPHPADWFLNSDAISFALINQPALTSALSTVRSTLPPVGALAALAGVDPITQIFSAVVGNAMDEMLTALQTVVAMSRVSYGTFVLNFVVSSVPPPAIIPAAAPVVDQGQCLVPFNGSGMYCLLTSVHDWSATTQNRLAGTNCNITIASGVITLTQGAVVVSANLNGGQNDQLVSINGGISIISAKDDSGTDSSTVNLLFGNGVLAGASGSVSSASSSTSLDCVNI